MLVIISIITGGRDLKGTKAAPKNVSGLAQLHRVNPTIHLASDRRTKL